VWHFQGVKHDLWDRDFPAAPSLVTVKRDGQSIDAVAQITKSGFVFVFERENGRPLFPIKYRKVPPTDVDGEVTADTQPFPLKPPPFARQILTPDLVTERTPEAHRAVLEQLRNLRTGGQFTPPSFEGTAVFPGLDGGGEWGGPAFDPETGILYVNANEMASVIRLVKRPSPGSERDCRQVYAAHCASCHRQDMRGTPPEFPALYGIGKKYKDDEIARILREGRNRMPSFAYLGQNIIAAMARFLITGENAEFPIVRSEQLPHPLKYTIDGYAFFKDPDGYPAVTPPWGTLNAISLETGEISWHIPFGEFPELAAKGMRNTGTQNYGGPVVTAGGLIFIGATDWDRKFHAYDKTTGKLLWEAVLPAAGNATPAVYEVAGREYVAIGAGGGKWGAISGGTYVAFALPRK